MENRRAIAPDAVTVSVLNGHVLRVTFENGEVRDFDTAKELYSRKAYEPLRDARMLLRAHVDNGVVTWTDDLDLDPEWLYEESVPVK